MTTTTVERVDAQAASELDIAREQLAGLSVDGLLELQSLINEELRQRVGSQLNSHVQNGVSNQPKPKSKPHSFLDDIPGVEPALSEEEFEQEMEREFTPAGWAAKKKEFEELMSRPSPKPWSEMIIEMRGGEV